MHADDASGRTAAVATDRGPARPQSGLDLCRDGRPQRKARRDRGRARYRPCIHRCEGESLPLDYSPRPRHARHRQDRASLDKERCGVVAGLWDGPASAAQTVFEFGKAWLTGEEPTLGENRKVTVAL